ncbi:hypothetical protein [Methanosarcina sp. KYL-1]|nr:hypothetical protein [Methanosarcina sp. KYL-1]
MSKSGRTTDKIPVVVYFRPDLFAKLEKVRGFEKRSSFIERKFEQMVIA